jgi:ADP-ribosylation factor-binding protein GGA
MDFRRAKRRSRISRSSLLPSSSHAVLMKPIDTFLQINDQINTVLNRYEAFKKGDYVTSSNPIPAELASGPSAQSQSLIDLDDSTPAQTGGGMDDLASLFASIPPLGTSTSSSPNLNQSTAGVFSPSPMTAANQRLSSSNASPAVIWSGGSSKPSGSLSPTQQQQHHQQMGSIALPGTPPINNPSASGNMSSLTPQRPSGSASRPTVPAGHGHSQTPQGKDPFADLVGLF